MSAAQKYVRACASAFSDAVCVGGRGRNVVINSTTLTEQRIVEFSAVWAVGLPSSKITYSDENVPGATTSK